ncbi:MAG: hypothetical protein QG597_683 [Actinomycetota bacterium]|nr:hypothetical protein [Actinomycetota bacterium]
MSRDVEGYRAGSGVGLGRYDAHGQELHWRTRQQLDRIEADRSVTRAVVDATEREEAHVAYQVMANGERLAHHAIEGLQRISRRIEETTRHNPNLEYGCREIETVYALAAAQHIARYMTRER